ARPLYIAAHANDTRAGVVRATEPCVLGAAHRDDVLHVTKRLDIVDNCRTHIEAEDGRKKRGLDPGIGALAFKRLDQARLFAADVSARAPVNVNLDVKP